MTKKVDQPGQTQLLLGDNSPEAIVRVIGVHTPQVANHLQGTHPDFVSLYIKQRGDYDFILVMKRYDSEGSYEVAFGSGASIGSALRNLEGSLAANKWKPDTPYEARNGKGN